MLNDNFFPRGERGKGGGGGEESLLLEETIVVSIAGNKFQWPWHRFTNSSQISLGNWPGVAGGEKGNSNVMPRSFPVSTGACYSPREGSTSQQEVFAHHLLWVCLPAIPLAGFIFSKRGHFLAKPPNSPEKHSSGLGLRNNRNFS